LLASFVVEVDKAGELVKGNSAVDALKKKLEELTAAAKPTGDAVAAAFDKIGVARANATLSAPRGAGLPGKTPGLLDSLRAKAGAGVASFKEGFRESSGLSGAIGGLATLRNGILALGAGAAVHALTGLVDRIGDISESAARLGVTVEEFQRLDVLAKQNDTSVGALGTAFRALANAAVDPTKETAAAFAKLDISTKDAAGGFKSRQDLFFETAGALADIGDGTERAALAQKLFGRGSTELLPLLAGGRAGLEAQRDALMQLPVFTKETVDAADALSDSWKTLGPQLLAAAGPLIAKLLIPGLKLATDLLFKMSKVVQSFTRDLSPFNVLLAGMALKLSLMVSQFTKFVQLSGGWAKWTGGASKAVGQMAKLAAAFLLIEDFIGFFQGKESVIGDLLGKAFGAEAVEGTRAALHDLVDVIKELFGLLTGEGLGNKTRQLGKDIAEFGDVLGNDLASAFGIGRGGTQGVFQGGDLLGSVGTTLTNASPFGGVINATAASLVGGGGQSAPNNVSVGDTTVIVNGVNPNNAPAVAAAASGAIGKGRDAIIMPYITGGPI
jgi:hypothetical protein